MPLSVSPECAHNVISYIYRFETSDTHLFFILIFNNMLLVIKLCIRGNY